MCAFRILFGITISWCVVLPAFGATLAENNLSHLTLKEAEAMALERDFLVSGINASARANRALAIAALKLPAPRLIFGLVDVPADSFSFEEPETQKMIGLQQSFPAWGSLERRGAEMLALAEADDAMAKDRRLKILRNVRLAWLELYYQYQAGESITRNQRIFDDLLKATQSRYRAGRGTQQDVVRAELELSRLEDRLGENQTQQDIALADLSRWLGEPSLAHPVRTTYPALPALPERDHALIRAERHPAVVALNASEASKREGVAVARAMFKPEVMIDVSYGQRDGKLSDMLTGIVSIEVPFFSYKHLNSQIAAAQQQVKMAQADANELRRELRAQADIEYVRWQRADQRLKLYEKKLLPLASQNSESSLIAYRSNMSDLFNHINARVNELDTSLEVLALQAQRGKAHINLWYLIAEE